VHQGWDLSHAGDDTLTDRSSTHDVSSCDALPWNALLA
jgi:hypothetical protein